MASANAKASAGNPSDDDVINTNVLMGDRTSEDGKTVPTNIQDASLVEGLRELIVRVVDPKRQNDIDPIALGPEAGKLISALQEFISSVVSRSQAGTQIAIQTSLVEEIEIESNIKDDEEDDKSTSGLIHSSRLGGDDSKDDNLGNRDTLVEKPQPTFHDKLQRSLREHVFNTMPIRLLCFEPQGDSLQITLVERGTIHAQLASALQAQTYEADHLPVFVESLSRVETDEEAIERLLSVYARYAILSHTWLRTSAEVTYGDWNKGKFDAQDPGYRKLVNFCKVAWTDYGLTYGWMDTVCINKESSSELDESIRSMYNWYNRADVCVIYLAETAKLSNMHMDPWFTRGWTLQELLAPLVIKFYNINWKQLVKTSDNDGADEEIMKQIEKATTISELELQNIQLVSISRRMQLAATREVTREEDTAYSLMGLFNVSISTAYGEGAQRSFFRLLQEILVSCEGVVDIFNWAGDTPGFRSQPSHTIVLPPSPRYYLSRYSNPNLLITRPMEPLTLTHLGLRVPVLLMPAISVQLQDPALHHPYDPISNYNAIVEISPPQYSFDEIPTTYNLLDRRMSGVDGWKMSKGKGWYQMTFAVFNFDGDATYVRIPKICLAIGLECHETVGNVTALGGFTPRGTSAPIVFELNRSAIDESADEEDVLLAQWWDNLYRIKRDELTKHGMQLVSLYL